MEYVFPATICSCANFSPSEYYAKLDSGRAAERGFSQGTESRPKRWNVEQLAWCRFSFRESSPLRKPARVCPRTTRIYCTQTWGAELSLFIVFSSFRECIAIRPFFIRRLLLWGDGFGGANSCLIHDRKGVLPPQPLPGSPRQVFFWQGSG